MSSKNWFGPRDSVVSLTPPEGFEAVHQEGMTWYKDGINEFETTKKFAYEFNSEIAQLRGLLTVSGIDLSDLPENSPFLLREVILRAIMRILSMQEIDGYGLLDKATYDPQGKEADPFARANHTGTQAINTIAGLQTALDSKQADLNKVYSIELGAALSSPLHTYIDFHTLEGPSDYSARIIRNTGVDGLFAISNTGAGGILIAGGPGGVALTGGNVAVNGNAVWHAGNFTPSSYMPLAGGTMAPGATINFANETAVKLFFYNNGTSRYGAAVESTATVLFGGTTFRFRGVNETGTILGELTASGFKLAATAATPSDPLHAASKQYVDSLTANIPGVYTGSSASETNFPVGHVVAVVDLGPDRNASTTVRLHDGNTTGYRGSGTGAVLSGTYRSRGYVYAANAHLMQRTA